MFSKDALLISGILAEDKETIPYRKNLREICGSVTATILLQQIIYWDHKNNHEPFYKFRGPCNHDLYKEGDSWTEELGFSLDEFDCAIKKIGTKIKSGADINKIIIEKENNKQESELLVFYWIDSNRVTHYQFNLERFAKLAKPIYLNRESQFSKIGKAHLHDSETTHRLPESTPPTEKNSSTGKNDYLSNVVSSAKNGTEKDQPAYVPDPFWGYRDAFLDIFNKKTGRYPSEIEKAEIVSLSEKSDACPHKWEESIKTAALNHNFGKPTLQRCIEIYKAGGTWELFREWKWGSQDEDAAKIPLTDSEKEAVKRLNAQMQAEMAAV